MVPATPLKSQARISFSVDHVPSPFSCLTSEMGSKPLYCVMLGGEKMTWMPCNMALERCCNVALLEDSAVQMKLLTKTSNEWMH